jgi:hypothetical protein
MSNEPDADSRPRRDSSREVDDEAMRARRMSPRQIMLLVMLLLAILLIAVAAGRGILIRFPGASGATNTMPTQAAILGAPRDAPAQAGNRPDLASGESSQSRINNPAPVCSPPGPVAQQVSAKFISYYNQYGGAQTFGRPISAEISDSGRVVQWFERTRLEEWPELQGTRYQIQGARVGVEFTKGILFPKQTFFVSQPSIRYFGETGQGVREPFLSFWLQNGGLDILGYPISGEVNEELEDGQLHLVQYFERARLEYHPAQSQQIQIGLLGHALCLENSHPKIVTPAQPTPVPLP